MKTKDINNQAWMNKVKIKDTEQEWLNW